MMERRREMMVDLLRIEVYPDRQRMGESAGRAVARQLLQLLADQDNVRMVFAAAPSQNEFLSCLREEEGIDWKRVTAFHMDEYIGLLPGAPQSFSRYLQDRLFDHVRPGTVHFMHSEGEVSKACAQYGELVREAPIDIVCLGIGENGHLAFNDPPVADFNDPHTVKVVALDPSCRQQQVNDGCFASYNEVPTHALTLTIPALMAGRFLYCSVPGAAKRNALTALRSGPVNTACPASILRTHSACRLFADMDAYGME